MQTINYLQILRNKWQVVLLTTTVLVLLTVIISLLRPFEYRSRVGMLIIQKQGASLDSYAAARASERLAGNLANIIKTDSFFNKVVNSDFNIDVNWPIKESKRRKMWHKMISTRISPETGILTIDVFHKNKKQAKIISQAIAYVLINNASEYHGGGDTVLIKVVDPALVSTYPVRPNILFNTLSALALGVILSSSAVIYQANTGAQEMIQGFDVEMEN